MNGGVTFGDTNVQVPGTVSGAQTRYLLSAKTYSPATHRPLRTDICPQVVAYEGQAGGIEAGLAASDCIIPIKRKRSRNWFIWSRKRSASVGEILSLITSSCRCLIRLAKTVYRFPKFTIISGMAGNKTPIINMSCCIYAFIAN